MKRLMYLVRLRLLAFVLALVSASGLGCAAQTPVVDPNSYGKPHFHLDGTMELEPTRGTIVFHLNPSSCERDRRVMYANGRIETLTMACAPFPSLGWQAARLLAP